MPATDLRLQPKMTTTEELVVLVRMVSFEDAVKLVNQFAAMHQATGRLEQAVDVFNREEARSHA